MERTNYNLKYQHCVETLSGPVCRDIKSTFLGNDIYKIKDRIEDTCEINNTFADCQGNVKFTLPLDMYKYLPHIKEVDIQQE
jgi:hypothetical protein